MIPTLLAALTFVTIPHATCQAALVQQPAVTVEPASDVRHVLRQTSAGPEQDPPPGMVLIPGGDTLVGTDPAQLEALSQNDSVQMKEMLAETPRHTVSVEPFFVDVTEVTNLQWKVFLDATRRKPSPTLVQYGWPDGEIPEGQDYHPITNVNVPEIREYLLWCGKRLPTEAEWTRAARGPDERAWPWGDNWDAARCQSGLSVPMEAVAVGSFPAGASPYGVLDMAGNVFEWVDSSFSAFEGFQTMTYGKGKRTTTLSPEFNSTLKVIKGGGYSAVRKFTRIDTRFGQSPNDTDAALGFRAARSPADGLEAVRHGLKRLLPPKLSKDGQLDEADMFGREITAYDETRKVITGYRYLAFAHSSERVPALSKVRRDAKDDPLPLGILVSSEPMLMERMKQEGKTVILPAGEYTVAFKSAGESKAHKEKRRQERESGGGKDDDSDKDDAAKEKEKDKGSDKAAGESGSPTDAGDGETGGEAGAAAPWPGVGSIHDIQEDIEFDQEIDAVLLYNANNVVVGWAPAIDPTEGEAEPVKATSSDSGRTWNIQFSLRQTNPKKADRFTLEVKLAGAGLE